MGKISAPVNVVNFSCKLLLTYAPLKHEVEGFCEDYFTVRKWKLLKVFTD